MGKYRFNNALHQRGLSYDMQGLIHFRLALINRDTDEFRLRVKKICQETAGDEWRALYRFLTDSSVNHVYIYNTYRIPANLLFKWKRAVYCALRRYV